MNVITTTVGHKLRVFYKASDGIIRYTTWNGSTWSKIRELQWSIPKFGITQITTASSDNPSYPSSNGWKKVTISGNNKGTIGIAVDGNKINSIDITETAAWSIDTYLVLTKGQKVCTYMI